MLDAPVSGGALGAEAATLTFMVCLYNCSQMSHSHGFCEDTTITCSSKCTKILGMTEYLLCYHFVMTFFEVSTCQILTEYMINWFFSVVENKYYTHRIYFFLLYFKTKKNYDLVERNQSFQS